MNIGKLREKIDQFDDDDEINIVIKHEDGDSEVLVESGTVAEITEVSFSALAGVLVTATVADEDTL